MAFARVCTTLVSGGCGWGVGDGEGEGGARFSEMVTTSCGLGICGARSTMTDDRLLGTSVAPAPVPLSSPDSPAVQGGMVFTGDGGASGLGSGAAGTGSGCDADVDSSATGEEAEATERRPSDCAHARPLQRRYHFLPVLPRIAVYPHISSRAVGSSINLS